MNEDFKNKVAAKIYEKCYRSKSEILKMINDFEDLAARRGAETPAQFAHEIFNFARA